MSYLISAQELLHMLKRSFRKLGSDISVVQEIVEEITNGLIGGDLKPGSKLPSELQLMKRFGVSRNAVREAIKMLVALGVVRIKRGEGTYVSRRIPDTAIDPVIFGLILRKRTPAALWELREMLEVGILEILLHKVTREDIRKMKRAIKCLKADLNQVSKLDRLLEDDLAFHYALAEATHNPLIIKLSKAVWKILASSLSLDQWSYFPEGPNISGRYHELILEGIEEKNLQNAKEAIQASLREWRELHERTGKK